MGGNINIDAMVEAAAVNAVPDMVDIDGASAAAGDEADAEGEEDWSANDTTKVDAVYQQDQYAEEESESDRDTGRRSSTSDNDRESNFSAIIMIGSHSNDQTAPQSTASSEEEVEPTASSEDDEFEDPTSTEEDEDDDDDDFVLNARQRGRRSRSVAENRRQRRRGTVPTTTAIIGNHGTPSFKTIASASEYVSNTYMPCSAVGGRSLRSKSVSTRYTPYQGFTEFYGNTSGEQEFGNGSATNATLELESGEEHDFSQKRLSSSSTPSVSMVRRRTRVSPSVPIPVPVPNLTKKSRGRRVPTMSSLEDLRSAASGAGRKRQSAGGRSARMYLCDVEGCGKCFARGEHLKRHVRSIHTYEKRKFFFPERSMLTE